MQPWLITHFQVILNPTEIQWINYSMEEGNMLSFLRDYSIIQATPNDISRTV